MQSVPDRRCPIKGNTNDKGERIYHAPWPPWYSKTKVNTGNGERWFCDEAEAVSAGWRRCFGEETSSLPLVAPIDRNRAFAIVSG